MSASDVSLPSFVLASASPARRRLLTLVGIDPIVYPSQFDESSIQTQEPELLVKTLARKKAEVVAQRIISDPACIGRTSPAALVLGCDSVLELDGDIYGKPENEAEAIARWQRMSGNTGRLFTGHALISIQNTPETTQTQLKSQVQCQVTDVTFAALSDRQIQAYVRSGEPLQCAGSFALEGRGGLFVERISGCHTNVIGLSLPLLRRMVEDMGFDIIDFWPAEYQA